jgi:hypothetical protein
MVKQVRDNSEVIQKALWKHLKEQRPITLYNTFKGIPVTYEAEVALVTPEYVGVVVHPFQAVGIKLERRTYLQSKLLPGLVRAYPITIDYTNQVVLLKRLEIARSISTDLYNSWVGPEKDVLVEISSDEREDLEGSLLEIAVLDENVVRAGVAVPEDVPYERLDHLNLTFKLPTGDDLVQVNGVVSSITKIRKQPLRRLEVEGKAAMQDEISILAFIATREDAIMGELERTYRKLRKGKKSRK